MPLALGMLMIVTLVAGGVATVSINASDEATSDRNAKRALAAAETGLQVANLRLNNAPTLAASACLVPAAVGSECPTYGSGDLGGGASYRFWVSQQLAVGDTCGRVPTQTATGTERCITAAGIVNGVERRLQSRVLDLPTNSSLVPVPGIFALDRVQFNNNFDAVGRVGSNRQVVALNSLSAQGIDLGMTGTFSVGGSMTYTQAPNAPVRFSPDKTLAATPVGNTATSNRNGSIVNGGGVTYTDIAGTPRSLNLNNATLTLTQSGDYNFCRLVTSNNSEIRLAAGVQANIYIDAPSVVRPGSGCTQSSNGWGEISSTGPLRLNYPNSGSSVTNNFKLFVVGWDPASAFASSNGLTQVVFQNTFYMRGLLYAPNAHVEYTGAANVEGASGLYRVTFYNAGNLNYSSGVADYDDPRLQYSLQGWRECRPQAPTAGDPESGC